MFFYLPIRCNTRANFSLGYEPRLHDVFPRLPTSHRTCFLALANRLLQVFSRACDRLRIFPALPNRLLHVFPGACRELHIFPALSSRLLQVFSRACHQLGIFFSRFPTVCCKYFPMLAIGCVLFPRLPTVYRNCCHRPHVFTTIVTGNFFSPPPPPPKKK